METVSSKKVYKSGKGGFSLEVFKAISLFLSTVVISLTGTLLTNMYNSNQIELNRNKELSVLIPKLTSPNFNERRQTIVQLSLYGKNAVLPLISEWTTADDVESNYEVLNSILIIGDIAIPDLVKIYNNSDAGETKRAWALYALIKLNYKDSKKIIKEVLFSNDFNASFATSAVLGVEYLKYKEMTTRLVQISKVFCNDSPDTILVKCIVSALKCLGGPLAKEEVKELLKNPFYFIRYEAVKSMIVLGDKVDIPELSLIAIQDKYEEIRKSASYAIKVIKMKNGL